MIMRLSNEEIRFLATHAPEQTKVDVKQDGLVVRGENSKAEFLKDIVAFGNSLEDGKAYIFYGVTEEGAIVGIDSAVHHDDADLQALVQNFVQPPVTFLYYEQTIDGKLIGVVVVDENRDGAHVIVKNIAQLREGQVLIRRGSRNGSATPQELALLALRAVNQSGHIAYTTALGQLVDPREDLGLALMNVLEWADTTRRPDLALHARQELSGYGDQANAPQWRSVTAYVTAYTIKPTGGWTAERIIQAAPDKFWSMPMPMNQSIVELSQMASQVKPEEGYHWHTTKVSNLSVGGIRGDSDGLVNIYILPSDLLKLLVTIRNKFIGFLTTPDEPQKSSRIHPM